MPEYPRRHLLIIGGGHASLPLIKMGRHWKKKNLSITLVSAEDYLVYSGALPQYLGDFYSWEETAVNLKQLCNRYAVKFIQARARTVNRSMHTVHLADGHELPFDYLVINVGARTAARVRAENVYPVKPMSALLPLKEQLQSGRCRRLLILGGGAAGTEIALNLSHPHCRYSPEITLIEKKDKLLDGFPHKASDIAYQLLKNRGVSVQTNTSSDSLDFGAFDGVILATGNEPESVAIEHSFPTGIGNRILTDSRLLVTGENRVFAAGDTADVDGNGYAPIGVHAVKQGKTLRSNIENLLENKPLKTYSPYPVNPLIISDGPNRALFTAGDLCLTGRVPAILKYLLDMKWLEKYTRRAEERRTSLKLLKDGLHRSKN